MKIRGPLVTLGAVVALGVGMWLVNVSNEDPAPPDKPVAQTTTSAPEPAPTTPAPPPAPAFPAKADYVGKIPIANGAITLEIAVEGDRAVAYACDGNSIETWLRGPAVNGALSLANKDKTSRLDGRLDGAAVTGTLWIDQRKWDFRAEPVEPPAGLYVYEDAGVRISWIIDTEGTVTGVSRLADGSTTPAPGLATDGTAVINGHTVAATRVEGGSDE